MFICFECCVLSGRGLCDGLITRPEEYCDVSECDLENLKNEEAIARDWAASAIEKKYIVDLVHFPHLLCSRHITYYFLFFNN